MNVRVLVRKELPLSEFYMTISAATLDLFMTITMNVQVRISTGASTLRTISMHAENNYTKMCVSVCLSYNSKHCMHVFVYVSFTVHKLLWSLGKLNVISHETIIMHIPKEY